MLDAEARIAAGHFALHLFVNAQDAVNGEVAVGVRGELPSGRVNLSRHVEELFSRR
jgi:hypothetical protein